MTLQAFFFDLDGTLLDSEVLYVDAVQNSLADRGCSLTHLEALELVYGKGWRDIFQEVTTRFPGSYDSIERMEDVVRQHFVRLQKERDIRITGSIQLLRDLSTRYPVAIVSGSPRQDIAAGIETMGIADQVQFYLGAEDYSPGKPHPSCYLTAAEKVGVPTNHCLVFEDSTAGVTAAKQARMFCVGLQRVDAPKQDLSHADAIYQDLSHFEVAVFERELARKRGL